MECKVKDLNNAKKLDFTIKCKVKHPTTNRYQQDWFNDQLE